MDEIEFPSVITAIGDSEFEGFVASTLFSQGWSVIQRALSFESLKEFLSQNPHQEFILIYSSDLPGIDADAVQTLQRLVPKSFGFESSSELIQISPNLLRRPKTAHELISYVRGNVRSPLLRTSITYEKSQHRAQVIAAGSVSHFTGTTTLSINLAYESSLLGKKTLLIDANFQSPSVALLLEERTITELSTWKNICPNLYVAEATQDNLKELVQKLELSLNEFDLIVLDIGSLRRLSNLLSDRRWRSQLITWSCENADQILVTSTEDIVALANLKLITDDLQKTSIGAIVKFVLITKLEKRRRGSQHPYTHPVLMQIDSSKILTIPLDSQAVHQSRLRRLPLEQINERGALRKSISSYVKGLFSLLPSA
jgi:cellulose biosynthesis protein BcsQ